MKSPFRGPKALNKMLYSASMSKAHLGVRIERTLLDRIDDLVCREGRTKTDIVEKALRVGMDRFEELELAEGFALLADPDMQDMVFPTGAQTEAVRIGD